MARGARWTQVLVCGGATLAGAVVAAHTDLGRAALASAATPTPIQAGPEPAVAPEPVEPRERPAAKPEPAAPKAAVHRPAIRVPHAVEMADGLGERFAKSKVITGASRHRLLLFTFDDGPDTRYTPELLDMLDRYGIKAVFFLTAQRIAPDTTWGDEHAAIAREIVERGHMVGNHTVDHAQLPLLDDVHVETQLAQSERIFEQVFGDRPWLFRPPGGARSARVDGIIESHGYTQMLWNLGAGDFQVRTAEDVLQTWKNVFERRREEDGHEGGIILLHDIHEWSVQAVPLIVEQIREWNCRALARGEELYDIVDDPSLFVVPRGHAEPGAEAPAADPPDALIARRQAALRPRVAERCE